MASSPAPKLRSEGCLPVVARPQTLAVDALAAAPIAVDDIAALHQEALPHLEEAPRAVLRLVDVLRRQVVAIEGAMKARALVV